MPKSAIRKALLATVVWSVMATSLGLLLAGAVVVVAWERL